MFDNIETDKTKIKATIKRINGARSKLIEDIQQAALAVCLHAHMHGDVTLINQLYAAVSSGMKQSALGLWMMDYAPVSLTEGDDAKIARFKYSKGRCLRDNQTELELTMARAAGKQWHEYKTEKPEESFFNVEAFLASLFKKLDKMPARPEDSELVAELRALRDKRADVEESA
jgi:hypothetical protein